MRTVKVNDAGLAAALALLSVIMAALISLLSLQEVSGVRKCALVMFSASIPLLSFSVSLELVQKISKISFPANTYVMLGGATCGIIGIVFSIWAVSKVAALTFGVTSIVVWILSLYLVVKR